MKKVVHLSNGTNVLSLRGTTMDEKPVVWATTESDVFLLTKENAEETYDFLKQFLGK